VKIDSRVKENRKSQGKGGEVGSMGQKKMIIPKKSLEKPQKMDRGKSN